MNTSIRESKAPSLRDILTEAVRYWERRRLYYNLVLAVIVVCVALLVWPQSLKFLEFPLLLWLFVLVVLANVCYCAAYLVDVPLQISAYRETWLKWRFVLWVIGMFLAAALTYLYMAILVLGLIL